MAILRLQVAWGGTLVVGGGLSTFYFDADTTDPGDANSAVATFLASTEALRANEVSWATLPDVAVIDEATGTILIYDTIVPASGIGTDSGQPLPPTVQVLGKLLTSSVEAGRLVRGRMFLPGATESHSADGVPDSTIIDAYSGALSGLRVDTATDWVVWSRTHGVKRSVTQTSVWNKFAVLRSRRD